MKSKKGGNRPALAPEEKPVDISLRPRAIWLRYGMILVVRTRLPHATLKTL
jgi:hypothetical protein